MNSHSFLRFAPSSIIFRLINIKVLFDKKLCQPNIRQSNNNVLTQFKKPNGLSFYFSRRSTKIFKLLLRCFTSKPYFFCEVPLPHDASCRARSPLWNLISSHSKLYSSDFHPLLTPQFLQFSIFSIIFSSDLVSSHFFSAYPSGPAALCFLWSELKGLSQHPNNSKDLIERPTVEACRLRLIILSDVCVMWYKCLFSEYWRNLERVLF